MKFNSLRKMKEKRSPVLALRVVCRTRQRQKLNHSETTHRNRIGYYGLDLRERLRRVVVVLAVYTRRKRARSSERRWPEHELLTSGEAGGSEPDQEWSAIRHGRGSDQLQIAIRSCQRICMRE